MKKQPGSLLDLFAEDVVAKKVARSARRKKRRTSSKYRNNAEFRMDGESHEEKPVRKVSKYKDSDYVLMGVGFVDGREAFHMPFVSEGQMREWTGARTKQKEREGGTLRVDLYSTDEYWEKFHQGAFEVGKAK